MITNKNEINQTAISLGNDCAYVNVILEWTIVWTPALALYLCVGGGGLCPAGFIAHLRLYRHIRQAAIPVLGTGFITHL